MSPRVSSRMVLIGALILSGMSCVVGASTFPAGSGNTPPAIVPAATISLRQGSMPTAYTLAAVSDAESAAQDIVVTASSVPSGLTVTDVVNANGAVTGKLSTGCSASTGSRTVALRATDPGALSADANLDVVVSADTPPDQGLGSYKYVMVGASNVVFLPPSAPIDNGSIVSMVATTSDPYTGTLTVDIPTGAITVDNPGPVGKHDFYIAATDNCGLVSYRYFGLVVTAFSTPPAFTIEPASVRIDDLPTTRAIARVSDAEDDPSTLEVRIDGNYSSSNNSVRVDDVRTTAGGYVLAEVHASCDASNASFQLRVIDSAHLSTTTTLYVDVLPNTPPELSFDPVTALLGGSANFAARTGPSDNGGADALSILWSDFGTFTGIAALQGHPSDHGVVVNSGPIGTHTLIVRARDNCNLATFVPLQVTVLDIAVFKDEFEDHAQ